MKPPNVIYIQWHGDEKDPEPDADIDPADVSWSVDRVFDTDIEYRINEPEGFDSPSTPDESFLIAAAEDVLTVLMVDNSCKCLNKLDQALQPYRHANRGSDVNVGLMRHEAGMAPVDFEDSLYKDPENALPSAIFYEAEERP